MKNIYVFPKLSKLDCIGIRIGGAGLGNILFTWARAVVFARKNNFSIINTTWKSLKIGPLLRGELDTRGYSNLFKENNISGTKKFLLLISGKRFTENQIEQLNYIKSSRPKIIIFSGMKNQMNDLLDDYAIVKEELLRIITDENLKNIEKFSGKGISLHIRMGDFYIPESEDEIRKGATNCRLPLQWYISIINKIRNVAGKNIDVNIFSDGTDADLADLLELTNVKRHYYGSAIADMLALSKSDFLIASNSTFSLWASYLGRMPTIWFPGTNRQKIFTANEIEEEVDYTDELSFRFKTYIKEKINVI